MGEQAETPSIIGIVQCSKCLGPGEDMNKDIIGVILAATLVSLITLWFIESWTKYVFCLFEIAFIVLLYLRTNRSERTLMPNILELTVSKIAHMRILAWFFPALTALMIILYIMGWNTGPIWNVMVLALVSFMPGYFVLSLSVWARGLSLSQSLVLSYALSYPISGILVLAMITLESEIRPLFFLSTILLLGCISFMKQMRVDTDESNGSMLDCSNYILVFLVLVFQFFLLATLYPAFALLPGTDISRHYSSTLVLLRNPIHYSGQNYLLFHLHEAAFVTLAYGDFGQVISVMALLSLVLPIAFYDVAKAYLRDIDPRLVPISLILFTVFSGLPWLLFFVRKIAGFEGTLISLFHLVNDQSYNGVMYGFIPFLWYVPLTASLILLLSQLMLLKSENLGRRRFIALFALLTFSSYLLHVTEAVIFPLFLLLWRQLSKDKKPQLDYALTAATLAFAAISCMNIAVQTLFGLYVGLSPTFCLGLTVTLAALHRIQNTRFGEARTSGWLLLGFRRFLRPILGSVVFVYILGLVVWLAGVPSFHTSAVVGVGSVPWFIFPVILGIPGLFAVLTLHWFNQNESVFPQLRPFVLLLVFSFVFGRLLTLINLNLFFTGYWEKRLLFYLFMSSVIIAPPSILLILQKLNKSRKWTIRTLGVGFFIGLVVFSGMQTTFLIHNYWILNTTSLVPSDGELQATRFLHRIFENDSDAYAVTLTRRSFDMLAFAGPPYKLTGMNVLLSTRTPEQGLLSLRAHNLSHPYLYMHSRDWESLEIQPDSWLSTHLLPILPIAYRNAEVTIYKLSAVSYPQENCETALVVPYDDSIDFERNWFYAYDLLSLGEYNYTTVYDQDTDFSIFRQLILSVDPVLNATIESSYDGWSNLDQWDRVGGTWQATANGLAVGCSPDTEAMATFGNSGTSLVANLSFTILAAKRNVSNYVSLIYDWEDQNNFKYVGLHFSSDGYIYAFSAARKNGQAAEHRPTWPGLKTETRWDIESMINMNVAINNKVLTLHFNGSQYFSMDVSPSGGRVGLLSTRFDNVLFEHLRVNTSRLVQQRSPLDYLDHVQSGSNLLVVNTNGYGYFGQKMLIQDGIEFQSSFISGSETISLPEPIIVKRMQPLNESIHSIANYVSDNDSSIYVAQMSYGLGKITYLNLQPILQALKLSDNPSLFYYTLEYLLNPVCDMLDKFTYPNVEIKGAFRELEISGDIWIDSHKTDLSVNGQSMNLEVMSADSSSEHVENISHIVIHSPENVAVHTSSVRVTGQGGLQALCLSHAPLEIESDVGFCIEISNATGERNLLEGLQRAVISSEYPVSFVALQPMIRGEGQAVFRNVLSLDVLVEGRYVAGGDLQVDGNIQASLYMSDYYIWVKLVSVDGTLVRSPPLATFDVYQSIPIAIFWGLVLLLIPITMAFNKSTKGGPISQRW